MPNLWKGRGREGYFKAAKGELSYRAEAQRLDKRRISAKRTTRGRNFPTEGMKEERSEREEKYRL